MASLIKASGRDKHIKNLGWLIRNNKNIKELEVRKFYTDGHKAQLTAYMNNGDIYICSFASYNGCWNWLTTRRSLYGLPLRAYGGGFDGRLMTVKKDLRW